MYVPLSALRQTPSSPARAIQFFLYKSTKFYDSIGNGTPASSLLPEGTIVVNSEVIGANVGQTQVSNLAEPVAIVFKHYFIANVRTTEK